MTARPSVLFTTASTRRHAGWPAKALDEAIAKLPIPKVMRYQLPGRLEQRELCAPAHGLVALHGADVVPVSALGLAVGNSTHGHRFEAGQSRGDPRCRQLRPAAA